MSKAVRLDPEQVYRRCDQDLLPFKTTETLETYHGIFGQQRAFEAMAFGIGMRRPDYNMFVMGQTQSGRYSFVKEQLRTAAKKQKKPKDWCYLNNLADRRYPIAVAFSAGKAQPFKRDIQQLIESVLRELPAAFENPAYQRKKSRIERDFNRRYDKAIEVVEKEARQRSIALYRDAGSVGFTPVANGQAMDEAGFSQLSEEQREEYTSAINELEEYLNESLTGLPQWRRESDERKRKLDDETAHQVLFPIIQRVKERYASVPGVEGFLDKVESEIAKLAIELVAEDKTDSQRRHHLESQFEVNLLVDHEKTKGGPVVFETHPTYDNLFGRIEYISEMGALITNYQLIRSGSLHRANGGYLVIEADKVLEQPFVWGALKRALKSGQLKIESPYAELTAINTISLNPDPIPLSVKIVMIGEREVYYLLQQMDPEFQRLFRVVVDFDDEITRDHGAVRNFSRLLKTLGLQEGAAHMTRAAVARLVEHSSRMAEHQARLSAHIGEIVDLISEADYKRRLNNEDHIDAKHIETALAAKERRTDRIRQRMLEEIVNEVVLIDTEGEAIGKSNGLTVLQVGDVSFGNPARITATVHAGSKGIVDIEKEVALGQPIHSKGVMILSGFLGHRYAQDFPINLSASIALEQSYGHVDGDSASLAEICALISALTHIPIRQCYAITGSINQYGEVQAVGGVNEKIEGFFELCQRKGLSGDQGVIIPKANQSSLMLKHSVVSAVSDQHFHIYTVAHVDEALELLCGMRAGELRKDGSFPQRTINQRVVMRLREIAKAEA